ncbi:MAG: hypothetical protein IPM64_17570 [Phycisphaerales bacterium]|nr:hypothetical protein [Phycisphaerales bacterium]
MKLSRAAILAAQDLKTEEIPVPEWGEGATITIRELTAGQRDECGNAFAEFKDAGQVAQAKAFRDRLLAYTLVDDNGDPMFALGELGLLMAKNGSVIDRIAEASLKLNKLEPKAIQNAAKPSGTAPSAGSSSG